MRKTPRKLSLIVVAALAAVCSTAFADEYGDARARLVAAYEAEQFDDMVDAAQEALDARPEYPGALFNLAFAQAHAEQPGASLATLKRLAAKGIDYGIADIEAFAAVRELPGYGRYAALMTALAEPVGTAEVAYRLDDGRFVPEGIAIDADGTLYLGSIYRGYIIRVGEKTEKLAYGLDFDHWSIYGMRLDGDTLWYASSAVEQFDELDEADAGKNGLFAINLKTNEIEQRAILPETVGWQVLGDLAIDDDGRFYLSDQTDGVVYAYEPDKDEFDILVPKGTIRSPQGLVPAGNNRLYVADYIGGLFLVDTESGRARQVTGPRNASLYGIDGMAGYGNTLIAIQNGIQPNRVVQLYLSDDGMTVEKSRILAMNLEHFDEPNLGQVIGDTFYFIANSHWNRFDRDGNLPDGLAGPIVLRVDLAE